MALVIEDGSGKTNAQSYVSLQDVSSYANKLGFDITDLNETHIMRAMRYLEGNYLSRWIGVKKTENQSLSWPRAWATRRDGYTQAESSIPTEVKDAVSALAIRAITTSSLSPDITRSDMAQEEEVGPIRVKYFQNATSVTIYRDVELILRPVILMGSNAGRILRS